jgi:hypothetical protein
MKLSFHEHEEFFISGDMDVLLTLGFVGPSQMDRQGFAREVTTTARCLGKNINWCFQAQGHIAESTS